MPDELRLEIDELKLNSEWRDQPKLYHEWALKTAAAQNSLDEEKSKLDVLRAELDRDIRTAPGTFGLVKVTEKALENMILIQLDYQEQVKRIQSVKHSLDIAKAAVNALEHRKRALTLLVELWIRDYYANPQLSTSREATEELDKREARTRGRRRQEDGRNDDVT